jgi:putative PIN family toxin of toxin-antitoxin system
MLVVIDTNILVSSLWSKSGTPAKIMSLVISGRLVPCYDYRIICEYKEVLSRPKFKFLPGEISALLDFVKHNGHSVIAEPLDTDFVDEADKKFYEVAKHCGATLITGNIKHFPNDSFIMTANDFLEKYL